jgi:hypothetical protein
MKAALERYVARWRTIIPAQLPPEVPPPSGALVAINPPLRAQLDRHCADCHDEVPYNDTADGGERPFDFRPAQLPRALLVSMTDHVAFGTMPKDEPLEARAREELVTLLIDTLWSDPAARKEAEGYHLGKGRGLPAHQVDNAIHLIDQKAQGPGVAWGAIERGIWSDQSTITPGFLALTGLEALRACAKARDERGVNLETCLDEATSIGVLSRWPVAP